MVRQPESRAVSLDVAPHLAAGVAGCSYHFISTHGLPPCEDRFELVCAGDGAETLQIKHGSQGSCSQAPRAI